MPVTCTLPEKLAGPLIWSEINLERDVCDGCNEDRIICKGRAKKVGAAGKERRLDESR